MVVGVSQQAISAMVTDGKLPAAGTLGEVLQAYCQRLRLQAAGRMGDELGGLDLVQERAALAREQREGQAIKNAVARKEFAPVGLLADVLGMAASAVVDRFDQLEGALRKACPDLPDEAKVTVQTVIAAARNEWIRSTERLVTEAIDAMLAAQDEDDTPELFEDSAA
jgi:phage terminase Nu1 subunit (DNA packaging protein)